ncbi:MAG: exonuclease domain-containing protein [Candidatus Accumulibacter meliphilus]|uniref:3'-5' exonuclease n=1 Tax=Candidatus Accumulibacter meliphilus TaxID=2211374 RepID=UPI002FC35D1B
MHCGCARRVFRWSFRSVAWLSACSSITRSRSCVSGCNLSANWPTWTSSGADRRCRRRLFTPGKRNRCRSARRTRRCRCATSSTGTAAKSGTSATRPRTAPSSDWSYRWRFPKRRLKARPSTTSQMRPEYYDFDLFHFRDQSIDLDRPLADLSYTVFDTETTGLEPAAGDEIIQIGAVRIVNNRMLRQENFNELVDPERLLRPEGIRIHGITDDMVRGQPSIDAVLPAFHDFCSDTVLVAHNAAFDMRFLQLKEERTGIIFSQPVLDTLLLSAVLHANQDSHQLEKIAERLGISIEGRHNALGDAVATSEVFLKMLPLLEQMGISTLRQALEASQKTYFARVKY